MRTAVIAVLAMSAATAIHAVEPGEDPAVAPAAEPPALYERIDRALLSGTGAGLAERCSDEEFLRRIYLDLTGTVPTVSVSRAFLADSHPEKRTALIDRLLASPQHFRHLATTLDVMLMERRNDVHVKADEWNKYLYESVATNKSWDRLANEILMADGTDEKIRAAAKFYLDRNAEPNLLTRDIGRVFLGMDLACCQCHNHPLIDSYLQSDYFGLFAYINRGTLFTDKDKKVFYAEKAEGDVKFTSVFTKEQDETRPCLPGQFELREPVFLKGQEYTTAPADGVRPVPSFSRRAMLAQSITSGSIPAFNRNIANRLWALMMGRGLVEPVDMHHVDNPPVHPELLQLLADELVRTKFDMRGFLRQLAASRTYQRALDPAPSMLAAVPDAFQRLAELSTQTEQAAAAWKATLEAIGSTRTPFSEARKGVSAVLVELTAANASLGSAQKASGDATKALMESEQQLTAKRELAGTLATAAGKALEAAAKLAGDTELAQAAGKFKQRADQFTGEIPAAEQAVTDRTVTAKSAAEALGVAQNAAQQIVDKLAVAYQQWDAARGALEAAQQQARKSEFTWMVVSARKRQTESVAELSATVVAAETARQKHETLQKDLATKRQQLATLTAQLPALESAMTAARSAQDEADKQLRDAQQQLADRQQISQSVVDAVSSAEAAVQKLPKDEELKQATELVKTRRDKLLAEVAEWKTKMAACEQAAVTMRQQCASAQQAHSAAKSQRDVLAKSVPELEAQLPTVHSQAAELSQSVLASQQRATQQWIQQFRVGTLKPLTPEQLAWSILTVTGVVDQQRAAAEGEVNKTLPLDPNAPDPMRVAEREKQIEQQVYEKLKGNVATFVGLFGHAPGQPQRDFFATVDQALYFANGGVLQSWLNPEGDNLLGRLVKLNEPQQVAEELYIGVLVRLPSAKEVSAVAKHLDGRTADRQLALQEMAWALITSNEFRFCN